MPGLRPCLALAAACLVVLAARDLRAAGGTSAELTRGALAACEEGRQAVERETRVAAFERGQALAERAVAADDDNADAHFALFCNMGELMRVDGETITSVLGLRRLLSELDRTLALNPHHADALASKGTFLIRLPRLLGGDSEKGEQLLRRVLELDPQAVSSRLTLARTCSARGDRAEAIAFASRALQIARAQGRADKVAEAQATLAELRAGE